MPLSEIQAIRILQEHLSPGGASGRSNVRLGIGDDAAVLRGHPGDQVCTVDSCEEGVHFRWEWMTPADVAEKSFHSALSDVVAMGAKPRWIVCHLSLGPRVTSAWLRAFARAQAACSRAVGAPVVGGNVSFAASTSVVTTVVGRVRSKAALLRSRARGGDEVWLFGTVGLARAGLLLLEQQGSRARGRGAEAIALRAFRSPKAQVALGPQLIGRAHACLDVSDGLNRDAAQLARASDVRLIVERQRLEEALVGELFTVAQKLGISPVDLALEGGEDYALLATGPAMKRPRGGLVIGRVQAATRTSRAGAFLETEGRIRELSGGFVHSSRC